jgi:hypothetical protein
MRQVNLLLLSMVLAASCASWLGWYYDGAILSPDAVIPQMPFPEDGKVLGDIYVNDYFALSYPLPEGWIEGIPGPDPSAAGYYVLGELLPQSEPNGTILIAAQDMFFASKPYANIAEMVGDLRQAVSEIDGMTIDREPTEVRIGDRLLYRVDFSGVGLYRSTFTTDVMQ